MGYGKPCDTYCGEPHKEEEINDINGNPIQCKLCGYTLCKKCGNEKWGTHKETTTEVIYFKSPFDFD